MSFGGGGAFTFGSSNNNNQQSSGFGGFGSGGNTGGGFGQSTTGFGTSAAGSNTFGGGTSAFGGGGGGSGGGFGSSTNQSTSLFGSKPNPFGTSTSTGGGLFGNTSNTNTGFGSGSNAFGSNNQQGAFGSGGSGGFGLNQQNNSNPFGSSTQGGSLFGQGGQGTTGGFSSNSFGSGTALSNQPVQASDGTAATPFQPTTEKDNSGQTSVYQSIAFQQPYQKYSFEELRLADYNAGRKYGNANGPAGAFGTTSFGSGNTFGQNSGGFGNSNTNTGFGSNSSGGFGSNNNTAFGSGGGGSLFSNNQSKPGGLFGQQTSSGASGGLFGTSNNNSGSTFGGGFGNNTNTGTGGGLFGQNSNQSKPGGLFGSNNSNQSSGFTFGQNAQSNASSGGGLFGQSNNTSNTGGSLFGNNQQQQNSTSGGLFGNNQSQASGGGIFGNKGGFGTSTTQGSAGGGLFGNAGTTNNSGGLFGNPTQNTNTGGSGLFGNQSQNAPSGGGLFGNQGQNKPSLFGQAQNTNTGGGLFGNNQSAGTNTGGGLFGNAGQNNQPSGGLFGNSANTGGGLFGNNQNQNKPTSLFGAASTNNQGGGLFGNSGGNSLFSNSQNQPQNQMQQQEIRHASLLDPNPYGQSSIWTGLPAPTPENAKPVFTPLTATQKMKESMMKPPPTLRLNQSRYMTPPRRNGYGFTYSTYGTPNSAASTPGGASLSGSMYGGRGWSGGSFGRSFNRSSSVQNLRSQFANEADDIWKPNAFSPAHRNSSGSIKRLTIDRSIRQDLFSRPTAPSVASPKAITNGVNGVIDKPNKENSNDITYPTLPDNNGAQRRRVTFDKDSEQSASLNGDTGALVRTEEDDESPNTTPQPTISKPADHSRADGLSTVPEDRESDTVNGSSPTPRSDDLEDQAEGQYWMKPTREEIKKTPKDQLRHFRGFQVGRTGCATITFEDPVDLTQIDLDNLFGKEIIIGVRTVTVYPGHTPPRGTGLNVRSKIEIANSWPRSHNKAVPLTSGPLFEKHVNRLKHVKDTEFVEYRPDRGVWVFRVQHYTRYGLDYDDDEMDDSELSPPPDTIEKPTDVSVMEVDDDYDDNFNEEDENDTFAFKKSVPGGFGRSSMIDYQTQSDIGRGDLQDDRSEHSGYSEEDVMSEDEESPNMPGSLPSLQPPTFLSPTKPILKASRMDTPGKPLLDLEGDWADQLQRTISPRKQNRDVLRDAQSKILLDRAYQPIVPKPVAQQDFRSSIDIMNSLFAPSDGRQSRSKKANKAARPDFEFPYAKRAKTFNPEDEEISEIDQRWHASFKPKFTPAGGLVLKARRMKSNAEWKETEIASDRYGVVEVSQLREKKSFDLFGNLTSSEIKLQDNIPIVQNRAMPFSSFGEEMKDTGSGAYTLAHVLFDDYEDKFTSDLPQHLRKQFIDRIKKDRLSEFLTSFILKKHETRITALEKDNPTAAAVLHLTAHDVTGACDLLQKVKNNRLMLLVAQLDGQDKAFMDDITAQLNAWRDQNVLSEINEDVRALYEICSGNVTISQGKTKPTVPVEDRASTFAIGEKYELDWIQCFALGLWYGRDEKDNKEAFGKIEDAVREYWLRCERGEESEKPGNDVMWTLLRLYAAKQKEKEVPKPVFPDDLIGLAKPWDTAAVFNLHYAITSNVKDVQVDLKRADDMVESLAFELSSRGDVASAVYALLHLSNSGTRKTKVEDLLVRFAGHLPGPDSATTDQGIQLWQTLTMQLRIPQAWIFTAKALYARAAQGDNVAELRYLVAAEAWEQAHECLTKRVAPACVVDEDWENLNHVVGIFGDQAESKVPGWENGGGVYKDFATLMTSNSTSNIKDQGAVIESLRKRLVELGRQQAHKPSGTDVQLDLGRLSLHELEEHVAIKEMARYIANMSLSVEGGTTNLKEILELPLTADQRLEQTKAMAVEYFGRVMGASGTKGEGRA